MVDGCQQVIAAVFQKGLVTQRTGSDNAHDLAFHRALAGGRITNLLADSDGLARANHAGNVAFGRMEGYPCHGNRITSGMATCGQGNVQQFCGFFSVVVKQLVEVPHAVEHHLVRVFSLDFQVLLHHRGVLGQVRHSSSILPGKTSARSVARRSGYQNPRWYHGPEVSAAGQSLRTSSARDSLSPAFAGQPVRRRRAGSRSLPDAIPGSPDAVG